MQVTRTSPLQNLGSKVIDELEGIPSAPLSSLSSVVSSARDVMKQSAKISSNASEAIQNNESVRFLISVFDDFLCILSSFSPFLFFRSTHFFHSENS